jgi:hypothetical protein
MANHPERGAVWIESRGGDPRLAAIVRYHETRLPPELQSGELAEWHAALRRVDAQL